MPVEKSRLKRGIVEIIGEGRVTFFNLDGRCRETITFRPEEEKDIKDKIGPGKEVLYFIEGPRLIHFELAEKESGLRHLYEMLPKEPECVTSA